MSGAHSQRAHAVLSASGSKRWMNCTPSARLEEKVHGTGNSVYAEEGTLAHELAELITKRRLMLISDSAFTPELRKIKNHKLWNEDMWGYVVQYCNYVFDVYADALRRTKDAKIESEQRLDYSDYVPEGIGTGDHIIVADGAMDIIDLKYGKGVAVSAIGNSQGRLYAIGALRKYELLYDIHTVRIHIYQPRIEGGLSVEEISVKDLLEWAETEVKPKAILAYNGQGETNPGEWCKFCKVKAMCTKLTEQNIQIAKRDFSDPHLLSDGEILDIYKQIPMLLDWAKGVQEYVKREMEGGKVFQGLKLVRGVSSRKWTDEDTAKKVLASMSLPQDQYIKTSLVGIPAVEKLVGKKEFEKLFEGCYIKPEGAPTVVSEDDKRPAIGTASAISDFSE